VAAGARLLAKHVAPSRSACAFALSQQQEAGVYKATKPRTDRLRKKPEDHGLKLLPGRLKGGVLYLKPSDIEGPKAPPPSDDGERGGGKGKRGRGGKRGGGGGRGKKRR